MRNPVSRGETEVETRDKGTSPRTQLPYILRTSPRTGTRRPCLRPTLDKFDGQLVSLSRVNLVSEGGTEGLGTLEGRRNR